MFDVSKRKKKGRKETHEKKNLKEKKSEKERKMQIKECAWCEKNRSIGENERKMDQKDDICPYFFEYTLLVL